MAALEAGQFPPRWMPDAAFGLGYPFFNYYASLPYYLAAAFKWYGFSFVAALKLTHLAGFLLAAWAMAGWLRSTGASRWTAFVASAAYTFAPFHLVNVYVRGDSLSEFWSFALFPLTLWAAARLRRSPSPRRAAALSLAYAALMLNHNISALIFTPFLGLYLAYLWVSGPPARPSFVAHACLAILLGLGLSAFFWLPALAEGHYVQLGEQTTGYFHFANHFRSADLVQRGIFFDFDPGSEGASSPFAMGLAQATLTLLGATLLGLRLLFPKPQSPTANLLFSLFAFALATLMITPLSRPLWEHLPLLPLAQFPWRFLSVQSVFAAPLIAAVPEGVGRILSRRTRREHGLPIADRAGLEASAGPAGASAAIHAITVLLVVLPVTRLRLDFIPLSDADVTPERLQLYEYFTGNIGTTIRAEYLPQAAVPRPYTSDEFLRRAPRLKVLSGEATGARQSKSAAGQVWQIDVVSDSARVAIPLFYFPGWTASANGRPVSIEAAPGLGYIAFDLPKGDHSVELRLGRTRLRAIAEGTSAAALAVLLWIAGRAALAAPPPRPRKAPYVAIAAGAALVAGSVVLHRLPAPQLPGPLNADFDQLAYFHRAPVHFEDGSVLRDLSAPDALKPSDRLSVQDSWADPQPSLAPRLSAGPLTPTLTGAPAVSIAFGAELPTDISPGVYFVNAAPGPRALTPTGQPRGDLFLAPLWVDGNTPSLDESLAEMGPGIQLARLTVGQADCGVDVRPTWNVTGDVPQNYSIALRLRDAAGEEWAALDVPAASPFYPTGLWRPGESVPDRYCLSVPPGLPISDDYRLTVTLYEASTLAPAGSAQVPAAITQAAPIPDDLAVEHAILDGLGLAKVDAPSEVTQGETLRIAAHWLASRSPSEDYAVEWSLTPAGQGETLTHRAELAAGSPSSRWPAGTYALGRHAWPLPAQIPPGPYTLGLRLLRADGSPASAPMELGSVEIRGRPRSFEVPPVSVAMGDTFGDVLKLWGVDAAVTPDAVDLTLHWGALAAPGRDYKFFVHLFDPATEAILAQIDSMPREYAYPTSLWAAGEVVSDSLRLPLTGVPPGEYRLAVGWYDPASPTLDRLPAVDADGRPLPDGRAVLPAVVRVPQR